jgi:hypothetical protein
MVESSYREEFQAIIGHCLVVEHLNESVHSLALARSVSCQTIDSFGEPDIGIASKPDRSRIHGTYLRPTGVGFELERNRATVVRSLCDLTSPIRRRDCAPTR